MISVVEAARSQRIACVQAVHYKARVTEALASEMFRDLNIHRLKAVG
jgi:hypothetical protein